MYIGILNKVSKSLEQHINFDGVRFTANISINP